MKFSANNAGDWKIARILAENAEARIVEVFHEPSLKLYGLKIPSHNSSAEETRRRLDRELSINRRLIGDIFVRFLDVVTWRGDSALLMEHFEGTCLTDCIPREGFPVESFLRLACQLVQGLVKLQRADLIHTSLIPDHLLYNLADNTVRIADFSTVVDSQQSTASGLQLTGNLDVVNYLAPEQTGRLNRRIDYRTDFYVLGATFYHLLAGHPPFESDDSMEVVHAHLTQMPTALRDERQDIPPVLERLIMRLLSKRTEDRYQSAEGLSFDLQHCLNTWITHGDVPDFELCSRDYSAQFTLPQRLYGRGKEFAELQIAFANAAEGLREVVTVRGNSGVGKSALVNELRKPLADRRGYLIRGKCERLARQPYAALTQAFQELVQLILTESDDQLEQLRVTLQPRLGAHGQMLIELVPELELIIGRQPALPDLPPKERQTIFSRLILATVRSVARRRHPLVLFLDDMQWADRGSLQVFEMLCLDSASRFLVLIGAWRGNETPPDHQVSTMIARLQEKGVKMRDVRLDHLAATDIERLLADTLHRSRDQMTALAEWIHGKTLGHPLAIHQLLTSLHNDNDIYFDHANSQWLWQDQVLDKPYLPENVVDLMLSRIRRLPPNCKSLLSVLGCWGSRFNSRLAALLNGSTEEALDEQLRPAIDLGLIEHLRGWSGPGSARTAIAVHEYQFVHDRVRQATYEWLDENERLALHAEIGRRLTQELDKTELEDLAFEVCDQLNLGATLLTDSEAIAAAELNLSASCRARLTSAFNEATEYALRGLALLPDNRWKSHYRLSLELVCILAEGETIAGNFDEAAVHLNEALHNASNDLDRIRVYLLRSSLREQAGQFVAAMREMTDALALLDIHFPSDPNELRDAVSAKMNLVMSRLGQRSPDDLHQLPEMSDPLHMAAIQLMTNLWTPAYVTGQQGLVSLIALTAAAYSLEHGHCHHSGLAWVCFGITLGIQTGDYRRAYAYGRVGLDMANRQHDPRVRARPSFFFGTALSSWVRPLEEGLHALTRAYDEASQTGDVAYMGYAAYYQCTDRFMAGHSLNTLVKECALHLQFLQAEHDPLYHMLLAFSQLPATLAEENIEQHFDEEDFLRLFCHVPTFMAGHDFGALALSFWLDKDEQWTVLSERALHTSSQALKSLLKVAEVATMAGLASLRVARRAEAGEAVRLRDLAIEQRARLSQWASDCDSNFGHKRDLLEAELASFDNDGVRAMDLYEKAITAAREHEFVQWEALAHEWYGDHLSRLGRERFAQLHWQQAQELFHKWGCRHKIQRLRQRLHKGPYTATLSADKSMLATAPSADRALDWLTALKASHAIMEHLDPGKITNQLLRIMAENAGANSAALLWLSSHDQIVIHDVYPERHHPLIGEYLEADAPIALCQSVLHYVLRTRRSIIINDAPNEASFFHSNYIKRWHTQCAMAVPLFDGERLAGMLYFENSQLPNAFNSARLDLLEVLGSQAVTALRNARLYKNLQESEGRFRDLIEGSVQGIVIHRNFQPLFVNDAFAKMTGYSADELLALGSLEGLIVDEDRPKIDLLRERVDRREPLPTHYDLHLKTREGLTLTVENMSRYVVWEGLPAIQSTLIDMTARRRYEAQIEHMASHDNLSGLPNRMLFQDRLEHTLAQSLRHRARGAVLFLDLDNFKEVNDSLGHGVGDHLIRGVAQRLLAQLKHGDTVARLGGDEFAVLLEDVRGPEAVYQVAQRLADQVSAPFTIEGHEIHVTTSVGITLFPDDSQEAEELVRFADLAMYSAKSERGNQCHFFKQEMNLQLHQRKTIAAQLRQSLGSDDFVLEFQPQIDTATHLITGFEALVRWRQEGVLIPPDQFLSIAESTGLIRQLGTWVLREACTQCARWLKKTGDMITVAVNVSSVQFHQQDLVGIVESVLTETGLAAHYLELEITESLVMDNLDSAVQTMERLNGLGVHLSIDDFGTGYSSLSYLKRFPVKKVKIDRAFVRDLEAESDSAAIATAIIELGHALGMSVVAEGVENTAQLHFLEQVGCDSVQGYLISRPIPAERVLDWMADYAPGRTLKNG